MVYDQTHKDTMLSGATQGRQRAGPFLQKFDLLNVKKKNQYFR